MKNVGIILAAGKGSRFKSRKQKIFLRVKNKTLVDHAINKLKKLGLEVNVIINKKNRKNFIQKDCNFLYQNKPLGTGHAIKVFLKTRPKFKKCLVMNADTPFIHLNDIKKTLKEVNYSNLSVLSYIEKKNLSNGVFIEVKRNKFIIKEYKLLNNKEKKNSLCNSGLIAFDKKISKEFFNIRRNLKKNEYLITDILKIISNKKYKTKIIKAKYPRLCKGINTILDFKNLKKI